MKRWFSSSNKWKSSYIYTILTVIVITPMTRCHWSAALLNRSLQSLGCNPEKGLFHGQVDRSEPNFLQIKSQPIFSHMKARFRHEHVLIDKIEKTLHSLCCKRLSAQRWYVITTFMLSQYVARVLCLSYSTSDPTRMFTHFFYWFSHTTQQK